QFGPRTFNFAQVVLSVRELAGDSELGLQVGVPVTDLVAEGADGSRYFFTVLDAAPEAVPASIDDVLDREAMVADWRALRRCEQLAGSGSELAARAAAEGLESFAASFGAAEAEPPAEEGAEPPAPRQKVTVDKNARVFEDQTSGLGAAENSPEAIDAIREQATTIDPLKPIDEVPMEQRITAAPVPSKLGVLVAQINGVQPLTWETLPNYADYATRVHWQRTFEGVGIPFPFQFEPLKERHAFSMRRGPEEEEEDAGAEATPPAATPEAPATTAG
ncbi:MAG TPA: hypothetical protein VFF69_12070, partial [Phycisphaerales bacterium]|nr:hypothetical protein [Phycisphaerales bacterium]